MLRNTVPEGRRPRAFGYYGAVMGTAAAIGPVVGGELTALFGWRAVFVANLPVILVSYALIYFGGRAPLPHGDAPARRPRFDLAGSVLLTLALFLLVTASRMK